MSFKIPRREFLQAGLALGALLPSLSRGQSLSNARRVPILQSFTDETSSLVVVLGRTHWQFAISEGPGQIHQVKGADLGQGRMLFHLSLAGLHPQALTQLSVLNERGQVVERRHLRGLDTRKLNPRVALMSCSNFNNISGQEKIWSRVPEFQTDLILFTGDIVYANAKWRSVTGQAEPPQTALERYIETWQKVDLYALDPLIPVVATWDDHDYGMNNGNATHPHRQVMWQMFRLFYPVPPPAKSLALFSQGPGISFRWHVFGRDLYLMDNRSFHVPGRTQWGEAQEAWFKQDYLSRPFPCWMANGTSFFAYSSVIESVQKNGPQSLSVLRETLQEKPKACVLMSGDVHASYSQKIAADFFGFEVHELVSSAVHSSSAGPLHRRSPAQGQVFYEGGSNFLALSAGPAPLSGVKEALDVACATPTGLRLMQRIT